MPKFVAWIGYGALFLTVGTTITSPAKGQGLPTTADLQQALAASERSLINLHIEKFNLVFQLRGADAREWETDKFTIAGDAWYNGRRESLARVSVSRRVEQWRDGKAPWLEIAQDIGYDGKFGRIVNFKDGPPSQLRRDHTGELLPDAPVQLRDPYLGFADGTAFSLNFYDGDGKGGPLSSLLSQAIGLKLGCDIAWDVIHDDQVLKLSIGSRHVDFKFWLDPQRGYLLRRVERKALDRDGKTWITSELMDVSRAVEAGKGIWFPLDASSELDYPGKPGTRMRLIFHAESVVANDPAFDNSIFIVPFPKDFVITDKVHGGVFQSSGSPPSANGNSGNAVTRPTGATDGASPTTNTGGGATGPQNGIPPSTGLASGAETAPLGAKTAATTLLPMPPMRSTTVATIALSAIAAAWRWRRRMRTAALALAVGGAWPCAEACRAGEAISPNAASQPAAQADVRKNCGITATHFALEMFGDTCDIAQVGRELGAGENLERLCSLSDIQKVCISHGLRAVGYKGESVADVLHTLPSGSVGIVRLASMLGGVDVGHFVSVVPSGDDVFVVDPPSAVTRLTIAAAATDLGLSQITGQFLVISGPQTRQRSGPAMVLALRAIDLGRIPVGSDDFVGLIRYQNAGTEALRIIESQVSCSCMAPARGDLVLSPGQAGTLQVWFTRGKVSPGHNQRSIVLTTNDPGLQRVKVAFTFDVAQEILPAEPGVSPRAVDYGRTTAQIVQGETLRFEVRVPIDAPDQAKPGVDAKSNNPALRIEAADEAPTAMGKPLSTPSPSNSAVKIFEYRARWEKPPAVGPIDVEIEFDATGGGIVGTFAQRVRLTGECVRPDPSVPPNIR